MCKYCDATSNKCEIFFDPLTQEYFLDIPTSEWDTYNDDWVYHKEYISYCPWCGRNLEDKVDFLKDKTPVFRFTTEYNLDEVYNLAKHLQKKYPNLIVLPQNFDVDWMTRENFENWVECVRKVIEKNELADTVNEKCNNCRLRYPCDEQTEFICKHNNYCKYISE